MGRPFLARFPGWCSDCEEPVSPGDAIISLGHWGQFEHVDCGEARQERPKRGVRCTLCGEVMPCPCDDWSPV